MIKWAKPLRWGITIMLFYFFLEIEGSNNIPSKIILLSLAVLGTCCINILWGKK